MKELTALLIAAVVVVALVGTKAQASERVNSSWCEYSFQEAGIDGGFAKRTTEVFIFDRQGEVFQVELLLDGTLYVFDSGFNYSFTSRVLDLNYRDIRSYVGYCDAYPIEGVEYYKD